MKNFLTVLLMGAMLTVAMPAKAEAADAEPPKPAAEVNDFTSVVSGIVQGFEALGKAADAQPAAVTADGQSKPAAESQPKQRPLKSSAILIAGGAGIGASVGKMTGKKNAVIIGAIAGGVAGLIYDRATYKNPKGI